MTNFASPVRTQKGRVNLIPNPSFEYGSTVASTYFSANSNCTVTLNTDPAHARRGVNSVMATTTTATQAAVQGYQVVSLGMVAIPVTPGTSYTFSLWVKNVTTARTVQPQVQFYSNVNGSLGTTNGSTLTTVLNAWKQASVTAVAPAGASYVVVRATLGTGLVGDVFYVDTVVLEPNGAANPAYFDGSFDGVRWRGTAHNSASETYGADLAGGVIQNVGTPVNTTDAASKSYVDTALTTGVRATAVTKRLNLIPDPSFASGTVTGWTPFNASTVITYNGTDSYTGTGSMNLGTTTTGSTATLTVTGITPNVTYTYSAYLKAVSASATRSTSLTIVFYNNLDASVGTVTGTSVSPGPTLNWVRATATMLAPATAVKAIIRVTVSTTLVPGDLVAVDGLLFEPTATVGDYFDGSSTGARWQGTANASVSELIAFDANGTTVVGVGTPVASTDAANKSYVDTALTMGAKATGFTRRVNLIGNPSFGGGTVAGWAGTTGTSTVTYTNADSYVGTGAMVIGTSQASTFGNVGYSVPGITAGTTYALSGYVKPQSIGGASATVLPRVSWYDASDVLLSTTNGTGLSVSNASTTWQRVIGIVTAPANAVRAVSIFQTQAPLVTDAIMVDGVLFEAATYANTYFDGSFAGVRWVGTANAAVSETIAFDAGNTSIINVLPPSVGTDAATKAYVDTVAAGGGALDSDLVTIAALAPADNSVMQRKGGAWVGSTPATVKTDLALVKADVGLASVDNTADTAKPVSTAQQAAFDLKANLASPTFTGTVAGITKTMVGLSNVDNTSDASKPISTAEQTALNLKANLASPTFTGTVGGITKSMVGLASVDNTADVNKPISTAEQAALDLKANLASPTFTGTVGGITKTMVGLSNVDNVSDVNKPVSTATAAAIAVNTAATNTVSTSVADLTVMNIMGVY